MPNYIYALHCPIAQTVRYIGKTNNPESRFNAHIGAAKKGDKEHHTARWLRKLAREGFLPRMEILETLDDADDWQEYERFYISNGEYFGWSLTNTNPGGEGGGFVRAEDKEEWIAKVKAGFTPEVRARISATLKVVLNRPETKAKHRANRIAQWQNPNYREEMVQKLTEANKTPEVRAKRVASSREVWSNPEMRRAASERLAAYYATPEGKENKMRTSVEPTKLEASRAAQIRNWQNPEYRSSLIAAKTSPEVIQKQKIGARNQWADPVVREKMVERITAAQRARHALSKRTPEQETARKEERLAKRRAERQQKALAFAASPEGITKAAARKESQHAMFAAMSAASAVKKEQARVDRIAAKNSPGAIAAREAKKLATLHAMYDRRNAASRAKKEAAGVKVRRSPYPEDQREEMNKQRKKLQRAAKLQAEKAAKLAATTATPYTESS